MCSYRLRLVGELWRLGSCRGGSDFRSCDVGIPPYAMGNHLCTENAPLTEQTFVEDGIK